MSEWIAYLMLNGPALIAAVLGVLVSLIALFALIPGDQPEKSLQKVVDFIAKFSRK